MQIKLQNQEINSFKQDASRIPNDEIHPILSYIHISFKDNYCTLTKNGLRSFIKKNIPCQCSSKNNPILVDENTIYNICEFSNSDTLEIYPEENRIKLVSGSTIAYSPTDDILKFPGNDMPTSEWSKIFLEAITAISFAVNFITEDTTKLPVTRNIFTSDKTIIASNGAIAFYKELVDPIPKMILRKEVANAILNMQGADYAYNPSYDFFRSGSTLIAFSKSEDQFYDLSLLGKIESDKKSFIINKDDLIKFNSHSIAETKSKLKRASFRASGDTLTCFFEDADAGKEIKKELGIVNGSGEFTYDPEVLNQLLRNIPSTICEFYPGKNKYFITDEGKTFTTLIMGII